MMYSVMYKCTMYKCTTFKTRMSVSINTDYIRTTRAMLYYWCATKLNILCWVYGKRELLQWRGISTN